jgi:hypothetical protein
MAFTKAWAMVVVDTISIILTVVASRNIAAFVVSLISIPAYCQTENLALSTAQWRELAFLDAAVATLDARIAQLNGDAVWTGMQRIVALVGDGHTFLRAPRDSCNLPIEIARFGAMNNAAQFRSQTAALLVGQTIGEKPNSYAEVRGITLPNSHLTVRYSTRYYKFSEGPENAIRPDREIIPSWADYKAGRDPVLDWVLAGGAI